MVMETPSGSANCPCKPKGVWEVDAVYVDNGPEWLLQQQQLLTVSASESLALPKEESCWRFFCAVNTQGVRPCVIAEAAQKEEL